MRSALAVLLCTLSLVGCGTTLQPRLAPQPVPGFDLVDPKAVDIQKYLKDYAECVDLANQEVAEPDRLAAQALGAAVDRATWGILGHREAKSADRKTVLKRCLAGRGYNILR